MPLFYNENIELTTQIGMWKINESESEFADGLELSKDALIRLSKRRSKVHRKGYLAIKMGFLMALLFIVFLLIKWLVINVIWISSTHISKQGFTCRWMI